jgi:hypothetical protein
VSGTRQRTYTRQQLDESRAAWTAGEFSDEWREFRHLAAMSAGIIAAPKGTKWDNWGDEDPTERAILIRAIREQPEALRRILRSGRVGAWSNVIAVLLRGRDDIADDVELAERESVQPDTRRQDVTALRGILKVLGRSS